MLRLNFLLCNCLRKLEFHGNGFICFHLRIKSNKGCAKNGLDLFSVLYDNPILVVVIVVYNHTLSDEKIIIRWLVRSQ